MAADPFYDELDRMVRDEGATWAVVIRRILDDADKSETDCVFAPYLAALLEAFDERPSNYGKGKER